MKTLVIKFESINVYALETKVPDDYPNYPSDIEVLGLISSRDLEVVNNLVEDECRTNVVMAYPALEDTGRGVVK